MSVSTASATDVADNTRIGFPHTRFAAVQGVQYALTDDRDPVPDFRRGGVMLSELDDGEFAIIVTGSFYNVTVSTMFVCIDIEAIPSNPELCVRFSTCLASGRAQKSWLHIRFTDRPVYARFMQLFWTTFDELTRKRELILSRLDHIAYGQPSNFTRHCRSYLGDGYFDTLEDSDDSGDEEADGSVHGELTVDDVEGTVEGDDGEEGPANDVSAEE